MWRMQAAAQPRAAADDLAFDEALEMRRREPSGRTAAE
jgi:hypothetical protein